MNDNSYRKFSLLAVAAGFFLLGGLVWVFILDPSQNLVAVLLDPVYIVITVILFGFCAFGYSLGKQIS